MSVKSARAKIVKGKIVTRARVPERAEVRREREAPVELTREEEDAMLEGIASIKAGKGISLARFRALLQRL